MIFFNMNVMKKAFVAQDVGDVVIKSRCVLAPAVVGPVRLRIKPAAAYRNRIASTTDDLDHGMAPWVRRERIAGLARIASCLAGDRPYR
ncbi:hypothetical protein [Herbaspirillum seropedicae]|uniref:hypothetical protein n=1 Tax=Herbaspirillum seropedicae TaxID=964 RepID=UPI003FCCE165